MFWKKFIMGNNHSIPKHDFNGPLFGGHYPGDFSLKRNRVDNNKPLPPTPPQPKAVRFGHAPPAWEFYKDAPTYDNTANTRYCSSAFSPTSAGSHSTAPPAYPVQNTGGGFYVVNR